MLTSKLKVVTVAGYTHHCSRWIALMQEIRVDLCANDTARNKKTWFVLFSFLVHAGDSNVCSGQYIRTNLSLLANLFVCVVVTVVSFWIGEREVYGQAGTNICDLVEYRRIA